MNKSYSLKNAFYMTVEQQCKKNTGTKQESAFLGRQNSTNPTGLFCFSCGLFLHVLCLFSFFFLFFCQKIMASTSGTTAAPAISLIPPPTVIDDTHKVYSIAITCIVLGFVAILTVTCRLAQRIHARAFGADDYLIIPGLVKRKPMSRSFFRRRRLTDFGVFSIAMLYWLDNYGRIREFECWSW